MTEGGWSERSLKPIGYALAGAIVLCAIAFAYRIFLCPSFSGGFALDKLFSFDCKPPIPIPTPSPSPIPTATPTPAISMEQLAAATLSPPMGYVSYRVEGGVPREPGSLKPDDNTPAPSFDRLQIGTVLRATAHKGLRTRPFGQSDSILKPPGTCFLVTTGFRFADETPIGNRSGGWIPVQLTKCGSPSGTGARNNR